MPRPGPAEDKPMDKILLSLLAAVVCSLAGVLLLRTAEQAAADTDEADRTTLRLPPKGVWIGAMAVLNLALALFLPAYYGLGVLDLCRTLLMGAILWACAWADARAYLIPNRVLALGSVFAAALLALELALNPGQALYLLIRTAVAVAALLLAAGLCRAVSPRAVGMGDVKLLAVMGLCLGMDLVWPALFFSFVAVFCVCVVLLITRRAKRTDSIPFAPFLLAGTLLAAFLTGI